MGVMGSCASVSPRLQPLPFSPWLSFYHPVNRSWVWGVSSQAGVFSPQRGPCCHAITLMGTHHRAGKSSSSSGTLSPGEQQVMVISSTVPTHSSPPCLPATPQYPQAARTCQPALPHTTCEAQARPRRPPAPGTADGFHPCHSWDTAANQSPTAAPGLSATTPGPEVCGRPRRVHEQRDTRA